LFFIWIVVLLKGLIGRQNMKRWVWIIVAALAVFGYRQFQQHEAGRGRSVIERPSEKRSADAKSGRGSAEQVLRQAFEAGRGDIQIEGQGVVVKTLPDDEKGSRHQRFILKLSSGQTLLVAHNIDLADKIKGLKKGDTVGFYGEYEWSKQGGVIHWTHRDPAGRHVDGWLKHNGRIYW
jgi:lipoprotein